MIETSVTVECPLSCGWWTRWTPDLAVDALAEHLNREHDVRPELAARLAHEARP